MLTIKKGNLFKEYTVPGVIVHGANAKGVMGAGFANQFKKEFPEAYLDYINTQNYNLGDLIATNYGELTVCSAITQENYGSNKEITYVSYVAVENALNKVVEIANNRPIYLPFIGGGLANGRKELLLKIFNRVFYQANATLFTL